MMRQLLAVWLSVLAAVSVHGRSIGVVPVVVEVEEDSAGDYDSTTSAEELDSALFDEYAARDRDNYITDSDELLALESFELDLESSMSMSSPVTTDLRWLSTVDEEEEVADDLEEVTVTDNLEEVSGENNENSDDEVGVDFTEDFTEEFNEEFTEANSEEFNDEVNSMDEISGEESAVESNDEAYA